MGRIVIYSALTFCMVMWFSGVTAADLAERIDTFLEKTAGAVFDS